MMANACDLIKVPSRWQMAIAPWQKCISSTVVKLCFLELPALANADAQPNGNERIALRVRGRRVQQQWN